MACKYDGPNQDVGCEFSVGGVLRIYVGNYADVLPVVNATTGNPYEGAIDAVTMAPASFLYILNPIAGSGSGLSSVQGVGAGGAVNLIQTVTAVIPNLSQARLRAYQKIIGPRLVFFVEMRELDSVALVPKWIMYGFGGGLLATTADSSTGVADADLSGFTYAFTGTSAFAPKQVAIGGNAATTASTLLALLAP